MLFGDTTLHYFAASVSLFNFKHTILQVAEEMNVPGLGWMVNETNMGRIVNMGYLEIFTILL